MIGNCFLERSQPIPSCHLTSTSRARQRLHLKIWRLLSATVWMQWDAACSFWGFVVESYGIFFLKNSDATIFQFTLQQVYRRYGPQTAHQAALCGPLISFENLNKSTAAKENLCSLRFHHHLLYETSPGLTVSASPIATTIPLAIVELIDMPAIPLWPAIIFNVVMWYFSLYELCWPALPFWSAPYFKQAEDFAISFSKHASEGYKGVQRRGLQIVYLCSIWNCWDITHRPKLKRQVDDVPMTSVCLLSNLSGSLCILPNAQPL